MDVNADLIISNANIYTMDAACPRAQALAIKNGRILAIGGADFIGGFAGSGARTMDAGGRLLLPGFQDGFDFSLIWSTSSSGIPSQRRKE